MRSLDPVGPPAATAWPEARLAGLTTQLASRVASGHPATAPAGSGHPATPPAGIGAPSGRVAEPGARVVGLSTGPPDRPWSVPLLISPEAEAWLLGWPAGFTTAPHAHRGTGSALTVVEGSLSEECLDMTIWTTGRRTTWKAGTTTLFPAGHVHLLGTAGGRPAVAVHAWSVVAGSAGGGAGRTAPVRAGRAAGGRGPGGGRGPAEPVGVERGRGRGRGCWAGQPAHGAADLVHVRDRVAG
jgi:quercetin dioxygenase-like cupin family protein